MDFVHAADGGITLEFREYEEGYTLTLLDATDQITMVLAEDDVRRIGYRLLEASNTPVRPCPDEECYYHDGD